MMHPTDTNRPKTHNSMLLCLSSGGLGEPVVVADGEVV